MPTIKIYVYDKGKPISSKVTEDPIEAEDYIGEKKLAGYKVDSTWEN